MKIVLFFLSALLCLSANAAQPCTSVADCQARISQEQATLETLLAGQAPAFHAIAKNSNGSVKFLLQKEAVQYCADQGAHLPSARELARLSMRLGAKGIAEVTSPIPDDSYFKISARNTDGSLDKFYFSFKGYQRPTDEIGNNWFWSSSVESDNFTAAFYLSGKDGFIGSQGLGGGEPVLCVPGVAGLPPVLTPDSPAAIQECTSVADCQARIAQDQATLETLLAGPVPTFLDIAKNTDGTVKYMNHYDAVRYCVAQGAHLPSTRELARLSMSMGAKGIAEVTSPKPDSSYNKISAMNTDGSLDEFYFSSNGYQLPVGELGKNYFWSSSFSSGDFGLLCISVAVMATWPSHTTATPVLQFAACVAGCNDG